MSERIPAEKTGHEWLDCLDLATRDVVIEAAAAVASTLPPPDPHQLILLRNTVGRAMSTRPVNSDTPASEVRTTRRRAV
jgi:hypothetical protein